MDRYIMSETIAPFLFGLGAFSSLGMAIGVLFELVRELSDNSISWDIALKVLGLQLPYYISLALPMAVLLGSLLGYSRLSSDNEIVALRSCGVSLQRIVRPALALGLIIAGINFTFDQTIVPEARYEAKMTLLRALKDEDTLFRDDNIIYPEIREVERENGEKGRTLVRLFYADTYDGQVMNEVTILDRTDPNYTQLVQAESARWNPDTETWTFKNGAIYVISPDGEYRNVLAFESHSLPLPRAPLDITSRRDYAEMNLVQSFQQLEILKLSGRDRKIRKLEIRIHQKFALPMACLAFALFGATLGIQSQRSSTSRGFGVCVLAILAYYTLMSIADALGLSGALPPWMAGWMPTLVMLIAGFVVMRTRLSVS
jgi:lipopolysaccharide export system permease protein